MTERIGDEFYSLHMLVHREAALQTWGRTLSPEAWFRINADLSLLSKEENQ